MKTYIGIRLQIEGFHNFPDAQKAFGKEVDFLEARHRHNFNIVAKKQVFHDNRDREFILLKREVQDYFERNFGRPAEFGSMSCEMICRNLQEAYNFDYVYCDEDGENFAEIIK